MATVSKLNLWFKYFIDETCSTTFLNQTESSRKAKYKCKNDNGFRCIGYQNYIKLSDKISKWLDDAGLSESALKLKLISLLNAKETKFQKIKGAVTKNDLPDNVKNLVTSGIIETDKDGNRDYSNGDSLIAVEVDAIEIQRKTLDMAIKVRGLYAAEKRELTGKDGGPIETKAHGMDLDALNKAINKALE